ncbi:hypothetical protein ACQ4PT_058147 [Festuca glaucescens]
MKNFMTALGPSTCYMEQRSFDNIIADVNDDNIDKGQCHHFSIREYVRQRQMSNAIFCSLSDEDINSSLVTTKTYQQWNCESCLDKLDLLYNRTPARTLNVPEHAVHKELSQEKGSAKCHSPSSYNEESTEVDRAINDLYESTPINQENGSAKYLPPSWGNKESTDAPIVNDKNMIQTYKRRKNTKVHDFINDSSFVDCKDRSESTRAGNSKEKHVTSIMQPDAGLLRQGVCLSEGNIPYTTKQQQQFQHLNNEVSLGNATEDEEDDCVITSVNHVSTRLLSGESHNQYNGENFTSYRDDTNLSGSFPPTMDISGRYQHPQNFSKPFCPVPRIGVLSLTLQKEVATYSESCGTQSGYRLGMSEEESPCQMYRGGNLALSSSQQVPANCSPQHLGYATSVAIPEPAGESSHSTKGKSKMVDDPSDKSSEQDMCVSSVSVSLSVAMNAALRGRSSRLEDERVHQCVYFYIVISVVV